MALPRAQGLCRDWLPRVTPSDRVADCQAELRRARATHAVVLDGGRPVGLANVRDLIEADGRTPGSSLRLMVPAELLPGSASFEEVQRAVRAAGRDPVLVTAADGRYMGAVDACDLVRVLVEPGGGTWSAPEGGITDANDAFLAMIGADRSELERGELNWESLMPSEYLHLDCAGRRPC